MSKAKYRLLLLLLTGMTGILSSCLKTAPVAPQQTTAQQSLRTILNNNYGFSMFLSALKRTGLDKILDSTGPYTLLVPDNDAFTRSGINADSLSRIDTDTLRKLIGYHIIPEAVPYGAIPQSVDFQYRTMAGLPVYFSIPIPGTQQFQNTSLKIVHINGITVNQTDILASNGVIHDLNNVLAYPAASVKDILLSNPNYSFLVRAFRHFGLLDQLDLTGPFTVLAPTNDIFLRDGIDSAQIDQLDTLTYKKFLFYSDIMTPQLWFASDIKDGPLSNQQPAFLMQDVALVFDSYNVQYGVVPYNYLQILNNSGAPPYYGYPFIYGDNPINLTDPNHLAVNGVVHGVDGVGVLPVNATIHP